MKNTDIQKIRQTLKKALELVTGERITYDAFPATDHINKLLENEYRACEVELKEALALLPCETCGGTGVVLNDCLALAHPEYEDCPDCQLKETK